MLRIRKSKLKEEGFTLIESLISVLLLAIVLAGGIALYFNADQLMTMAVHKKYATELANMEMEIIRMNDYSTLVVDTVKTTDIKVDDKEGAQIVTITQPDPQYKKVELQIQWTEFGQTKPHSIDLVTFVGP